MTVLKKSLCRIDGTVEVPDVNSSTPVPVELSIPLSMEIVGYGVMDGHAWIEEHEETSWPWFIVLLFFWIITPQITKKVYVQLLQNDMRIEFDFVFDGTKTIHENLYQAPDSLKIKQVWFT